MQPIYEDGPVEWWPSYQPYKDPEPTDEELSLWESDPGEPDDEQDERKP